MTQTEAQTELPAWTGIERPRRADARRNFDALLAAGREAFAEHGPDASLEDVARRAGVGIATLYRNFPTRDSLIEAVYIAEVERLVEAARRTVDQPAWQALEDWLHHFIEYVGTKKVLIESLNSRSDVLQTCRVAMFSAGEPVLARAQQSGEARADTTIEDVIRLVSGVAGVAFPDDDQRERVLGLAIDGLRAR